MTLHAPRGMAISGDVLWVADLQVLRRFDRRTGAPAGQIEIPGATILNDVAAASDGVVYASDSGLNADRSATGTDAIWRVAADGSVRALAQGPELGQPTGLVVHNGTVYYVSWRDGTFCMVDDQGKRTVLVKAPQAQLDGLVRFEWGADAAGGGSSATPVWMATSWAGHCVYSFALDGSCDAMPLRVVGPADCGFDPQRRRLLIPLVGENRIEIVAL